MVDDADGLHTGKRSHALKELAVENFAAVAVVLLGAGDGDDHGDDVVRIETGIDGLESKKASNHEARADQKDEGKSEFRGDEKAAQAVAARSFAVAAAAFLERVIHIDQGGLQSGSQAKADTRKQCDAEQKECNARIDADRFDTRNVRRAQSNQDVRAPYRTKDSNRAAQDAEQQIFREKLANHTAATGRS